MNAPTLSVIVSNYNHAEYLPHFFETLLNQSYQPNEIIIIDDASTDNSVEIIEGFIKNNPNVKLVRNHTNQKPPICYYKIGWELATGDYLFLPGVDDLYLPNFIEKQMKLLKKNPEAGCALSFCLIEERGTIRLDTLPPFISNQPCYLSPEKVLQAMIKKDWFIMGNTCIWNRKAVNELKGFPFELGPYLDEFTHLMLGLNYGICFNPEPLALFKVNPGSFSSDHTPNQYFEFRRKQESFMENDYAGKFPSAFVEYHKKTTIYREGLSHLNDWSIAKDESKKYLEIALPKNSLFNQVFHWFTSISSTFLKSLIKLYLFIRLGRLNLQRIKQFFNPSRKNFTAKEMPLGEIEKIIEAAQYFQTLIDQKK